MEAAQLEELRTLVEDDGEHTARGIEFWRFFDFAPDFPKELTPDQKRAVLALPAFAKAVHAKVVRINSDDAVQALEGIAKPGDPTWDMEVPEGGSKLIWNAREALRKWWKDAPLNLRDPNAVHPSDGLLRQFLSTEWSYDLKMMDIRHIAVGLLTPKRLILTDPDGELGNMYVDISAASLARKFPNLKLADFAAWLLKNGARKNKQR
jgi:hypothetical protein